MLCFKVFYIFNSTFLGPVLFIGYFSKQSSLLSLYHVNFFSMNHALRGYFFRVLLFEKYFWGFSGKVFFSVVQ